MNRGEHDTRTVMAQPVTWSEVESRYHHPRARLLDIVWRRKGLAAASVAIALLLGGWHLQRTPRRYQSTAQLWLSRGTSSAASAGSPQPAHPSSVLTQGLLRPLHDPQFLAAAVRQYHLASLASLAGQSDPAATIRDNLTVATLDDSQMANLVELAYRGSQPGDCPTILEALLQSYLQHLRDQRQGFSAELLRLLRQAKDDLAVQIQSQEAACGKLRADTPWLAQLPDALRRHQERIAQDEETRRVLVKILAELKPRIEIVQAALKKPLNYDGLSMLVSGLAETDQVPNSSRLAFQQQLFVAMLEERQLLAKYGLEHPSVQEVRKKINLLRENLGIKPLDPKADSTDFVGTYLVWLQQEQKLAEARLRDVERQVEGERKELDRLDQAHAREQDYQAAIQRQQKIFDAVVKRLVEISLADEYGTLSAQLVAAPDRAVAVQPAWGSTLGLCGGVGLVCGVALGCFAELAQRRLRPAARWPQQLGITLLGRVASGQSQGSSGPGPFLAVRDDPQSPAAAAYRAAQTALSAWAGKQKAKIVQVTSLRQSPRSGPVAANLALAAAAAGQHVLLIDGDLQQGTLHEEFSLDNRRSLSSFLSGTAEAETVIASTAVDRLSAVVAGPQCGQSSDLLTSPRLRSFLEQLRSCYDILLVNSPPLLASADASLWAARTDAALLVLAETAPDGSEAERGVRMLRALNIPIAGALLYSETNG